MAYHPFPSEKSVRRRVYSFRNALDAVRPFTISYARATNFIAKKLGFDPKDFVDSLIRLYIYQNPRWNVVRDTIKKVERWNMYEELAQYGRDDLLKYLTCVKTLVEDEYIDAEN